MFGNPSVFFKYLIVYGYISPSLHVLTKAAQDYGKFVIILTKKHAFVLQLVLQVYLSWHGQIILSYKHDFGTKIYLRFMAWIKNLETYIAGYANFGNLKKKLQFCTYFKCK